VIKFLAPATPATVRGQRPSAPTSSRSPNWSPRSPAVSTRSDVLVLKPTAPQPESPVTEVAWADHLAQPDFFVGVRRADGNSWRHRTRRELPRIRRHRLHHRPAHRRRRRPQPRQLTTSPGSHCPSPTVKALLKCIEQTGKLILIHGSGASFQSRYSSLSSDCIGVPSKSKLHNSGYVTACASAPSIALPVPIIIP
jgi:hypothetical protein